MMLTASAGLEVAVSFLELIDSIDCCVDIPRLVFAGGGVGLQQAWHEYSKWASPGDGNGQVRGTARRGSIQVSVRAVLTGTYQ